MLSKFVRGSLSFPTFLVLTFDLFLYFSDHISGVVTQYIGSTTIDNASAFSFLSLQLGPGTQTPSYSPIEIPVLRRSGKLFLMKFCRRIMLFAVRADENPLI